MTEEDKKINKAFRTIFKSKSASGCHNGLSCLDGDGVKMSEEAKGACSDLKINPDTLLN